MLLTLTATIFVLANCSSSDANSKSTGADSTAVQDSSQMSENGRKGGFRGRGKKPGAVPVEVTALTRGNISSYLKYSSTLQTEQTVDVYPRIGGLVEAIYVEEGQWVRKGQKLLQIEKETYELAEQKAHIEYQKQEADYKRLKALEAEELLSEKEFGNAELAFKLAEIAWKQAALNLKYTTVTAPISGVIGERTVNIGDRVQTATNLFKIANLNEKIVHAFVPQDEFTKVYKKQQAAITTDILPDEKFAGHVKRISPIIDPQSGTFKVTVAVNDPKNHLRPGMFVNTELIVSTHKNARLIPKSALIYENERTYFFVVENDTSKKFELTKGYEDAEKVELLNDLQAGAKIVVLGQNGLKDGTKVKIIQKKTYAWQDDKTKGEGRKEKGVKRRAKGKKQGAKGKRRSR